MMYKLVHDNDYPYVHQEGQDLAFHFPQTCQVFRTISEGTSILSMINPDVSIAMYLVKSLASLEEPRLIDMKMVITYSPD